MEASQDATADVENLVSLIMVLSKEKKVPLPFVAGRIGRPAMRLDQLHWWIGVFALWLGFVRERAVRWGSPRGDQHPEMFSTRWFSPQRGRRVRRSRASRRT